MRKHLLLLSAALTVSAVVSGQKMTDGESHSKYILAVDEYVPAPGQFVNVLPKYEEGDDAAAMAAKCTAALAENNAGVITLGAYGGYVTFHFDHSIANIPGERDFYIMGNATKGGAEPGVVMVSKDTNGNGLPDDEWYELAGSVDVDSVGKVVYGYSITYAPDPMNNIPWTDSRGQSGTVDRNTFHAQEYFPQWMEGPLTFTGTLLPSNCHNTGTAERPNWVLNSFRYGYVDNVANTDIPGCSFDLSWAVDGERRPVDLDFIDFVRVYNGMNQKCGWIGETSTEVSGAEDIHPERSIAAIIASETRTATFEEVALGEESYWNGSDMKGTEDTDDYGSTVYRNSFASGSFRFNNTYNAIYGSWSGFAVSNQTSVVFNSYDDQYHSSVGHGYDKSANYAVVFPYGETVEVMNKPEGDVLSGFYVANAAANVNAYLNGDGMTGKFEAGDWCKLTVTGHHADGTTSAVEVYLADYRAADEASHYYIDYWQWVDLASLGKVKELSFAVTSSHNNDWGMTTPGYFCMDNLNGEKDGTAGITSRAAASAATPAARYSLDGRRMEAPRRGVNIVRMSDGTVRKVFVK